MANLYSALIFEGHDLGGTYDIFMDPGYVWVVRDICTFLPGPNADIGLALVEPVVGGTFYQFHQLGVPPAGITDHWEGRQVFVPPADGIAIRLFTTGIVGGADCRISGYRLTPP